MKPILSESLVQATSEPRSSDLNNRIERTIEFMRQNLDKPLQASVLAAHASMSLSHFFALFKRLTGRTPIDYLISLRMQRGRDLLASTELSIKEVAALLSYDDAFYFSRVFKAANGLAPTQYRSRFGERTSRPARAAGRVARGAPLAVNGSVRHSANGKKLIDTATASGGGL